VPLSLFLLSTHSPAWNPPKRKTDSNALSVFLLKTGTFFKEFPNFIYKQTSKWYNDVAKQSRIKKRRFLYQGESIPFLHLSSDLGSVKTQLHSDGNKDFLFYLSFVWRQSEFAFFGA